MNMRYLRNFLDKANENKRKLELKFPFKSNWIRNLSKLANLLDVKLEQIETEDFKFSHTEQIHTDISINNDILNPETPTLKSARNTKSNLEMSSKKFFWVEELKVKKVDSTENKMELNQNDIMNIWNNFRNIHLNSKIVRQVRNLSFFFIYFLIYDHKNGL